MSKTDAIEELAARWLARVDRGLGSDERDAFEGWLEQSVAHRVAYLRLEAIWRHSDRLAALKTSTPLRSPVRAPRFEWELSKLIAAAIVVLTICGAAGFFYYQTPNESYVTDIGQRKSIRLVDGTVIEINTNTRLQATVTQTTRTVTLDQGEAYFEVVHDAKRPFEVIAGNRRITDIGTKFSVYRDGDDVHVVVKEGSVRVDNLDPPVATPVFAIQNNVIIAKADETLVTAKPQQEISNYLDWRQGMLTFNQETLADAAAEFNRYNIRHIHVEGRARDIRIGGSFRADNIDVFASLLHQGFGLTVQTNPDEIVVSE